MHAIIALGSNVGHSLQTLPQAVLEISKLPGVSVLKGSSLYNTAPVGYLNQDDFTNAVIEIECAMTPQELYRHLAQFELDFGRVRLFKDGPRTLDLDVILCDEMISTDPYVILPHPRAHERAFVLVPLCEIMPEAYFPTLKKTAQELLSELPPEDLAGVRCLPSSTVLPQELQESCI